MATAEFGMPADPRRQVFRKIVSVLQSDATLKRLVGDARSGQWFVWDGDPASAQDFGSAEGIAVRLTPKLGRMDWLDETEQTCPLTIVLEYLVPGFDVDDPLDFQGCIERALYPPGRNLEVANALVKLGAETGLITFDEPALDTDKGNPSGLWWGKSQFTINVRRTLNS